MRKGFLIVLAVALVAALAAPAVAGTDINGFYRAKAWVSNFRTGDSRTAPVLAKDAPSNAFVEQRMRIKFSFGEENVKAVFFTENDLNWGDAAGSVKYTSADTTGLGAVRNTGGALGSDRINTEVKNTYVWFKLPNTSLDFTVGLQNQSDAYAGLLFGAADFTGVFAKGKFEPVDYVLGWGKLYEMDSSKSDDLTVYVASGKFVPTKDVKVGVNFYFLQDDTAKPASSSTSFAIGSGTGALWTTLNAGGANKKKVYIPGIDFSANLGPATLSGFFIYETGKVDYLAAATKDIDIKGFAFDLRGDMNVGPGKAFIEGLYITGGDNVTNEVKSIVTFSDLDASPGGNSAFGRTDMSILLVNLDDINCAQALAGARATAPGGNTSPALGGRGLLHIAGGYTQKFTDKITGKVGAGYLRASKLLLVTDNDRGGKALGTEVNANVNYNIMKGLDFGLYGAYAWLGNYFDSKASPTTNPDNPWSGTARVNYAF